DAEIVVVPTPVGWKVTIADESPAFNVTGEPKIVPTAVLLLPTFTVAEMPGASGSASCGFPDPSSATGVTVTVESGPGNEAGKELPIPAPPSTTNPDRSSVTLALKFPRSEVALYATVPLLAAAMSKKGLETLVPWRIVTVILEDPA